MLINERRKEVVQVVLDLVGKVQENMSDPGTALKYAQTAECVATTLANLEHLPDSP